MCGLSRVSEVRRVGVCVHVCVFCDSVFLCLSEHVSTSVRVCLLKCASVCECNVCVVLLVCTCVVQCLEVHYL